MTAPRCSPASSTRCSRVAIPRGETSTISPGISPIRGGRPPNLTLLNNALRQTGWSGPAATPDTWRELIADKLRAVDWQAARQDVTPFLERAEEVQLVTSDVLLPLLRLRPAG